MKTPIVTTPQQRLLNWCCTLAAAAISSASLMPQASHAELIRMEISGYGTTPGTSIQSVAINSSYIAVGNPTNDSDRGAVIIFDTVSGKRLKIFQGGAAGDKFGHAVALRGTELIVGAPGFNGGGGVVKIYDVLTKRELFSYDAGSAAGQLGFSVAADGEFIVAGAPTGNNGALGGFDRGYAVVFRSKPGGWGTSSSIFVVPDDPENDAFFGYSVAVYGSTIAVGAPFHNATALGNSGKVYLFDGTALGNIPTHILDSVPALNNNFGWAVALTPTHLVASTPFVNANSGRVDYYNLSTYSTISSVGIPGSLHGSSLAASETHVAVGSPGWSSTGFSGHGMVEIYQEPTNTAIIPILSDYLRPLQLYANGKHGFCVALHGASVVGGAKDQGAVVLGTNLTSTEGTGAADRLRDQFRKGDMVANTGTIGTRAIASFTQAGSSGIAPSSNNTTSLAIGKDRNYSSSLVDGLFATGPAGLNTMSLRSKVAPSSGGGFPNISSISVINDIIGNSPDFYAFHVTAKRTGRPVARDLWIFNPSTGYPSQIIAGNDLTDYVLASFTNARHGVYGASDLFVLPSTLRTKTGSPVVTKISDSALLFFNTAGAQTSGLREGTALSPYGLSYGQFTGRCGFEKNNLVFSSALQGATQNTDTCVVNLNLSTITSTGIAREDEGALGTGGAKFSAFLGETANGFANTGEVLFRATVRGGSPVVTAANNEGLWTNRNGTTPPALVFRKGDNPSGIFATGVTINRFIKYWINNYGRVYTLVGLTGPGITKANDVALLESTLSNTTVLHLREGDTAPGLGGGIIGNISRVDGRENGNWTALCTVVQKTGTATATNNQVLYSYQDSAGIFPQPMLTLRKGARIGRAGSDIIKSINLANKLDDGSSGAMATGMGHVMSPTREITAILTYQDGHQSVTEVKP